VLLRVEVVEEVAWVEGRGLGSGLRRELSLDEV